MAQGNKKKQSIKKQELTKEALLSALAANLGNVSKTCEAVGISRKTYYEYLKDEDFKFEVESIEESNLDFAESKLRELIDGVHMETFGGDVPIVYKVKPDVTATIFFLKTKGKKRGYVEKSEVENSGSQEVVFKWVKPNANSSRD
jgi:predicted DNA-binding transcriptional regulator AlpA